MTGLRKLLILMLLLSPLPAAGAKVAEAKVLTDVRVIHASAKSDHIDPALRGLGRKLTSIFRYTSYRQIKQKKMRLEYRQTGAVSLPGRRILEITPVDLAGGRIKYRIRITKGGSPAFRTEIMLKKGSSITIGGPEFKDGVLLFNIFGTIQK